MSRVASSVDGVAVSYETRGSGDPALLFIHGLAGDRSDFDAQMAYFAPSRRVVAVDLPGSGESGRERNEWTMAAYGADVASVADDLGLEDIILVGHSLGGDVTVEAALRLSDRVGGLVWISSFRSLGKPKPTQQIEDRLAPFRSDFVSATDDLTRRNFGSHADPTLVERTATKMSAADPEIVIALLEAKQSNEPALLAGLERLKLPVVAINPDFKANDEASLAAHGVDLMIVPGVGHFTMIEDPEAFNAQLDTAIERIASPA